MAAGLEPGLTPGPAEPFAAGESLWQTSAPMNYALLPSGGALASASTTTSSSPASSFLGEFTRVEIGHIVIGSDGKDLSISVGFPSPASQAS